MALLYINFCPNLEFLTCQFLKLELRQGRKFDYSRNKTSVKVGFYQITTQIHR